MGFFFCGWGGRKKKAENRAPAWLSRFVFFLPQKRLKKRGKRVLPEEIPFRPGEGRRGKRKEE